MLCVCDATREHEIYTITVQLKLTSENVVCNCKRINIVLFMVLVRDGLAINWRDSGVHKYIFWPNIAEIIQRTHTHTFKRSQTRTIHV